MALAVRRVGGTAYGEQTYTVPEGDQLRLDAVSFQAEWANQGTWVIPTVTVKSVGGATIAEIQAPSLQVTAPSLSGFTYSGPAAMADQFSLVAPGGYAGWLLHDFGAGAVSSQITLAWTQPPALGGWGGMVFLRSAGAVSMTPDIGIVTVENTDTATVQLTGPVAAGKHLALHLTLLSAVDFINLDSVPAPTVTDSVGGNTRDPAGYTGFGFAANALLRPDGLYLNSAVVFYRIVNSLSAGDTLTLTLTSGPALWMRMDCHPVTGLTAGNPIGPNPGGNYVSFGVTGATSPDTSTFAPVPVWTGGVFINSSYRIASGGTVDVQLARGGVEIQPNTLNYPLPATSYSQAPMPELHLGARDTITVSTQDTNGVRGEDGLSDFLLYGADE